MTGILGGGGAPAPIVKQPEYEDRPLATASSAADAAGGLLNRKKKQKTLLGGETGKVEGL